MKWMLKNRLQQQGYLGRGHGHLCFDWNVFWTGINEYRHELIRWLWKRYNVESKEVEDEKKEDENEKW